MTTLFTVTLTNGNTHMVENVDQVTEPIVSIIWSIPKLEKLTQVLKENDPITDACFRNIISDFQERRLDPGFYSNITPSFSEVYGGSPNHLSIRSK